jgi:hypothetical protein
MSALPSSAIRPDSRTTPRVGEREGERGILLDEQDGRSDVRDTEPRHLVGRKWQQIMSVEFDPAGPARHQPRDRTK